EGGRNMCLARSIIISQPTTLLVQRTIARCGDSLDRASGHNSACLSKSLPKSDARQSRDDKNKGRCNSGWIDRLPREPTSDKNAGRIAGKEDIQSQSPESDRTGNVAANRCFRFRHADITI